MKERIQNLLLEITDNELDIQTLNSAKLLSEGYLDSFHVLLLISDIEQEFDITFDFDDTLFEQIDTLASITKLIESKVLQAS